MSKHEETIELNKGYTVHGGDLHTDYEKKHSWFTRGVAFCACLFSALILFHVGGDERLSLAAWERFGAFLTSIALIYAATDIMEGITVRITFKIKEGK